MDYHHYQSLKHLVGCRLKRNIFSKKGVLVLSQSTVLTEQHLRLGILQKAGLTMDDVMPEDENNMDLVLDEALVQVRNIFWEVKHTNRIALINVRNKIIPAIHKISDNSG
ncbi:MAG: rpfG 6, partial [Bacilli bacterium]|nr:rpfG 6 [Bacilli bacterium]